jgi:hypothetical protein
LTFALGFALQRAFHVAVAHVRRNRDFDHFSLAEKFKTSFMFGLELLRNDPLTFRRNINA